MRVERVANRQMEVIMTKKIDTTRARQGETLNRMRYVLGTSIALAVIALAIVALTIGS